MGNNDIDEKSGVSVINYLKETIDNIREKYDTVKIILSEITPRKDNRDEEVKACNRLISKYANNNPFIFVAYIVIYVTKTVHSCLIASISTNIV